MKPDYQDGIDMNAPTQTEAKRPDYKDYKGDGSAFDYQSDLNTYCDQLERETATLHAQIARMKGALKFLVNEDNYLEPSFDPCAVARAALQEGEQWSSFAKTVPDKLYSPNEGNQ